MKNLFKIFTFLLGIVLFFCQTNVSAQCSAAADRVILMEFYTATNGQGWTNIPSGKEWGSSLPLSEWYGIQTNANGCVTGIDLDGTPTWSLPGAWNAGNNLVGTIPSSLGSLGSLNYLSLAGNNLSGGIPSSLGNLVHLVHLCLAGNPLGGNIPDLGALTDLQGLILSSCQLEGPIPTNFGNFTNLLYLYLGNNQLNQEIPASLGNLHNLIVMYMAENQLTGPIPSTAPWVSGCFPNLSELWLFGNKLSGSIPDNVGDMTFLNYLLLYNNEFSGPIPANLGNTAVNYYYFALYENLYNFGDLQDWPYLNNPVTSYHSQKTIIPTLYANNQLSANPGGNLNQTSFKWYNGTSLVGTTPTYVPTQPGLYHCEMTHATVTQPTVAGKNLILSSQPINTTAACISDVTVDYTVVSGTTVTLTATPPAGTNYTYNWVLGGTSIGTGLTLTHTFAGAGAIYEVHLEVTIAPGCIDDITMLVNIPCTLTGASAGANATVCSGASTTLTASPIGGDAPFDYIWSNGTLTATNLVTSNVAGTQTYTVTITDALGCEATSSVQVQYNPKPSLVTTLANPTCSGGLGTVTFTTSGGTSPITVLPSGNNLSAGTYTFTATDANGCTANSTATVVAPNPLVITGGGATVCSGNVATMGASGGTPGYSYSWTGITGTSPSGCNLTFSSLTSNTPTITNNMCSQSLPNVSFKVTDANGCTASTGITVTRGLSSPSFVEPTFSNTCIGATSLTMTNIIPAPASDYTFSITGSPIIGTVTGTFAAGSNTITVPTIVASAGTYTITVTIGLVSAP
ncbi:MAG: hypothetical protein RLZZ292_1074, partial [Bacteroidota bacterium]